MKTMQIIHHNITFDRSKLEQFCLENGIKKLSLFGSVLRDDFGPEGDIDMLVEFMPGEIVGFIRLARTERELSNYFSNRKVDLRTPENISDYFRERVLREAETLYYIDDREKYMPDLINPD